MTSPFHPALLVRNLGLADYRSTWQAMVHFTANRTAETDDELWVCEHPPVYTLGQAGKPEHLLQQTDIELVQIDRGGQITYHGPGQVVIYLLLDLNRRPYKVRELVQRMEQALINFLQSLGIAAIRLEGAPGVYIPQTDSDRYPAKIAALGLRIKKGCSYHGLSLNVAMELSPFSAINPCGYAGMPVTQLSDQNVSLSTAEAANRLVQYLTIELNK